MAENLQADRRVEEHHRQAGPQVVVLRDVDVRAHLLVLGRRRQ